MSKILGISAYYHDSAAALVIDGKVVAAAQEERFTRKKHDYNFPTNAVAYCLEECGLSSADELDYVVFYDKPLVKFERLLETYLAYVPRGLPSFFKAMPLWLKKKLWMREMIADELDFHGEVLFTEHHESHAASAFFPCPYEKAAILTIDGVGEWATVSLGLGEGNKIKILKEINFPHSLGLLYSAFTYFTGFRVNSGEYKLMGLAPYGQPKYVDEILEHLIDLKEDGSFQLNMSYFDYCAGLHMTNKKFADLFGGPARTAESKLTQREMDLAASVQKVTEMAMLRMVAHAKEVTGADRLVLAGGVALNCVGNGKVLREGPFEKVWIQPAAGDAGGSLGAAMFVAHQLLDLPRTVDDEDDLQSGSYLGPVYSDDEIGKFLSGQGIDADRYENFDDLAEKLAEILDSENVIGCFQGRMEFGPRALGGRSIIGDARSREMQTKMNLKIKFRESFRPFAPSVLREHVNEYFDMDSESPYMLLVADVQKEKLQDVGVTDAVGLDKLKEIRSVVPAITHVDNSARVQTVDHKNNPGYYKIIKAFYDRTGCPVIVNTSFNVRGEPIVCTPADAYRCFTRTNMDYLVLGSFLIDKKRQNLPEIDMSWQDEFELD